MATPAGITRVQYRERQRLTAEDLRFEQDYRLGMTGRHHLGPHEWGVIRGLRVVQQGDTFRLLPGVAIDGYGRELLVPAAVDLPTPGFDKDQCRFVHLYYCEYPEQVPPGRLCKDSPAPRIRQRTAIQIADSLFGAPDTASDLLAARAAGALPNADFWPVLVARICRRDPPVDYSQVTYANHRAAGVRTPTGNARLQLGTQSLRDVYHLLISTKNSKGLLNRRLGIDRDRSLQVWQPLWISGPEGQGQVLLAQGLEMKISMPMPAGLGRTLRIEGRVDPELRTLSASLLQLGHSARDLRPVLVKDVGLAGKTVPVPFDRVSIASVSFVDSVTDQTITIGDARKKFRRGVKRSAAAQIAGGDPDHVNFSMQLERTTSGRLSLVAADAVDEDAEIPCGDVPRTRGSLGVPSTGIALLQPATQVNADPLMREIHAVYTSKPEDAVPKTELRLSGGGGDDSDAAGRVSLGVLVNGDYVAALRMDGGKRIRMLAGPGVKLPQQLLSVKRTVYLPPIGKNDPLLPDLMTLASISGLFQIGNFESNFKIQIDDDSPSGHTYKITVPKQDSFTVKRTLELIIGNDGTTDMSVRTLTEIVPGTKTDTHQIEAQVSVPGLAPSGRKVIIAIVMLIATGNRARVAYSQTPLKLKIP